MDSANFIPAVCEEAPLGDLTLESKVSELTRTNEALAAACLRAEVAGRARNDFLVRMSHEIRTPLNLINGMISLLLESPLNEKQRHHLGISYRNVRRLLRLINGISDLSKVETGELTFQVAPFDLDEVLSECAATISAAVERKGLQLEIEREPSAQRYWMGDTERLQQVLLNLVGNAIKFTEQGKIEVKVLPERGTCGHCGLRFEVSDTGCGVPLDQAQSIFDAFEQVDGSINRSYEGSGLGLAVAKALVERMSGAIWLDQKSSPGCKFVFTVFLPIATEQAVREKTQSTNASSAKPNIETGTRILLVEDNPENAILVQAYLEGLPVSLDLAPNGLEAVERARRGQYHLILMDIQMPVMDGYAATREIRKWEKMHGSRRVPIVALTAHALTGAMAECISMIWLRQLGSLRRARQLNRRRFRMGLPRCVRSSWPTGVPTWKRLECRCRPPISPQFKRSHITGRGPARVTDSRRSAK
jgi:signal transduction histidine kinase/CheY-like chemotaxis protein